MIYSRYLGIDPGLSGGLAVVSDKGAMLRLGRMPATEAELLDFLLELHRYFSQDSLLAVLERAQAFPKQGVTSAFNYGMQFGGIRAMLIACRIPFEEVRPAVWQKAMGCLSHGDKNRTKLVAQQLFPGEKVTHAIADALLLAEYGRRKYGNAQS